MASTLPPRAGRGFVDAPDPVPSGDGAPVEAPAPAHNGLPPLTPGTGLGRALRRHLPLFLAPVVLLTAAGVLLGLARTPVYTAESRLMVGKVNPNSPALGGFVQTTTALATAYSRSIGASAVVDPVGARLRLDPAQVASRLTASPIPQSPVVRVIATGATAPAAVAVARLAAPQLERYVTALNASNPDGPRLLRSYRSATLAAGSAQARVAHLARVYAQAQTPAHLARLDDAQADRGTAQLTANAAGAAYELSEQGQASTQIVTVLSLATSAATDRRHMLELLAFAGLLAGLLLGTLLAWAAEQRGVRPRT